MRNLLLAVTAAVLLTTPALAADDVMAGFYGNTVISTGGAVVQAARMLEESGAHLTAVICAIWRPAAAPAIADVAAPVLPVFTAADLGA